MIIIIPLIIKKIIIWLQPEAMKCDFLSFKFGRLLRIGGIQRFQYIRTGIFGFNLFKHEQI